MSRYKAYPEYKDSGVENLGTIPSNWEVMQLRRTVLDCVNGIWGNEPENDGSDTIVIRVADFDRPKLSIVSDGFTYRKIDSKEKRSRVLARGDLLLEKSGGGEKTLVGQVVLFDKDFVAVTSNFVAKMTPSTNFSSSYLNYVFCRFYSSNINYCSIKQNTGIQNLDSASYLSEKFGFPPLHEQERIAAFLDYETAKIDALIEKQQRLIELLKEKRQAVISHAVTKGLNPNASMKDSGVEWLCEVPAHWEVSQLRYVVRAGTSITYGIVQAGPEIENGVPYIRTSDMSGDALPLTGYPKTSPEIDASYARSKVNAGDLVISIRASVGKCLPVPSELDGANLTQGTAKIAPSSKALGVFMLPFIGSSPVQLYLDSKAKGATFKEITLETLRKAPFLVPPVDEQVEIGRWVVSEDLRFKALIEKADQAQVLLKERRTALISAAVTGKIDVRDWQAAA